MKHTSQMEFGPANCAVPDVIERGPDKWALLNLLTEAADMYELSHRTLSVLKALLTFLPGRHIPNGPRAVVFPANRTLSHRLSGMPESTLRRHLALLVRAGIVSRQDSPNRKRFARHRAGQLAIAYGFDLSPFAQMSNTLEEQANAAREETNHLAVLRSQVIDMRALLIASDGVSALTVKAARELRRKPMEGPLRDLLKELSDALEKPSPIEASTKEMNGSDVENERHIHTDSDYSIQTNAKEKLSSDPVLLSEVTEYCTAFTTYFPEKIRDWHDLFRIAAQLPQMLGIAPEAIDKAYQTMGRRQWTVVILCILERFHTLKDPTAFLYGLIKSMQHGVLRLTTLLRGSKVPDCQLTI